MTLRARFSPKASLAAWFVGGLMVGAALSVPLFGGDLEIMLRWVGAAREDAWLRWWGDFASRSCFEGGALGAKDISHFFVALVLAAYGLSFRQAFGPRRFVWRAWATYSMACLLSFFAVNRGMKLFFGRVRPSEVLRGDLDFTPLWSIGNYDFLDALSKGSFASGHTTTSMVLLPLAFLALGGGRSAGTVPLFALALGWGAFAGWGRVITGAHYPSDIVWAMVVCVWVCVLVRECLFPAQAPRTSGASGRASGELRTMISFALGLFLVFLFATGVKETILRFAWWWPLMAILSGLGAWYGLKSAGCFKVGRVS